jgi:hypothetical protein
MGGWFDIVARVASGTQDFVYCEFGSDGTEIIERVNGADTQLARAAASTTDYQGATESFGMKVYGNDIACLMNNQEVVGAHVQNNESPTGGIGFVVFGQPQDQKHVMISNISATALTSNTIIAPFPVAVVTPPPVAAVVPAPVMPTAPPTPPVPTATPAPTATTTKTIPYTISTFSQNQGWKDWWGNFLIATDTLTISSNNADNADTGAGGLLGGGDAWKDYTFTATLDWVKGQTFSLMARYSSGKNYVMCGFDDAGNVSIFRTMDGNQQLIGQGSVANFSTQNPVQSSIIQASIQVRGTHVQCGLNGGIVQDNLYAGMSQTLMSGGIGFTVWDQTTGNSKIIVKKIDVTRNAGE